MVGKRSGVGAVALMALVVGCGGPKDAGDDALGSTPTPAPSQSSVPTPVRPSTVATDTPSAILDKPTIGVPSSGSVAGLSAKVILAKTQAAAKAATSVRMKGAVSDGKERMVLDVRVTKNGGQGSITTSDGGMSVMVIGKTAYLKMSNKFWQSQTKSKAEADAIVGLIAGRWIKTTMSDKDLGNFALFASKAEFFDTLFEPSGAVKKTAPKTVDGVPAIGLGDGDGTLWVDTATARPVSLESGSDKLSFSEYNQVTTPKAPPASQVIDGKALGM
ncbi:hypothetical protein [Kribbella jiaozuonensis]|uniref:Lipoprotein n=1 Tax=Kribbella jiaozuonensis TaxID=2575441 RepID=A0A4U3LQ51_9ACTN|nr:hypothetical protein [Kribbella jiaozuonensis]TKK76706.1 hypothetical protein FDA38_30630 [Kribbella jiaozuonensis]